MENIVIPETLPKKTPILTYSNEYFHDQIVICYYHSAKGYPFPINMHAHDFYEINIIVSGEGFHCLNEEKIRVGAGEVFIIPPHLKHGYFQINNLEVFHILLSPQFFDIYKKSLKSIEGYASLFDIEPFLRSSRSNKTLLRLSCDQFDDCIRSIHELIQYTEKNVYHYHIQAALAFKLICEFCNYYHLSVFHEKHASENSSYVPTIVFAMEYMKSHLSEKLTIDCIARHFSISSATFIRYFTSIVKISPMEHLTQLRIKQSKKMLRSTQNSITFIAYECGFYDSSHFLRTFKKHEGITPSEYRKLSANTPQ